MTDGQITTAECWAMQLLAEDGWTSGELRTTFHLSKVEGVHLHTRQECRHPRPPDACLDPP